MTGGNGGPVAEGGDENGGAPRLDHLAAHQEKFQVDGFYKALQRGGSKLSRIFSLRPPKGGQAAGAPGDFSLEDMLMFSPDPIPTSLLKLSNDYASRAVKMFSGILKYMTRGHEFASEQQRIEIIQKLLHQGLKRPELKDELYMQLVKQTRGNPTVEGRMRVWELFNIVASTMPPSKDFVGVVSEHIHSYTESAQEDAGVKDLAFKAWNALKRSAKAGARTTLPSVEEIEVLLKNRRLTCIVFFLDETFEELSYNITTTVLEAVEQLASIIKLQNYSTFTLFECRKPPGPRGPDDVLADEHMMLDDNRYIADILFEFKNSKAAREGFQSKLLLKKRMFRETDETITEPQFVNLSYIQAQYDYLMGNYPVVREDAAQLCALQMQAEYGSSLMDSEDEVAIAIEKYIAKQALVTRSRDEWRQDVMCRYRSLEQFSKEDARLQFLRILRSLPYGNSIFFSVKRIEDPIGLLPSKLVLGINKRGVHFFRPVPKEYLHSAELRDIMQFGSSTQAVFFKMRVAGVLHIFQFETKQGEDICLALQTHINDIMMKRYSKAKAMAAAEGKQVARDSGPKYEKHVNQMQKMLEDSTKQIEELQKREEEMRRQKDKVAEELEEAMERLKAEEDACAEVLDLKGKQEKELKALEEQLVQAREELGAAEAVKAAAVDAAKEAADAAKVKELEIGIQKKCEHLQQLNDRVQSLEKQYKQASKEKDLMEKKMQRLEKSREAETQELREKLDVAQGTVSEQMEEKEAKIMDLMEELGKMEELYQANKHELEQIRTDLNELEDLREMKADVERKEKQQKAIIGNQMKRLDELQVLHKDEQMLRKRYMSMMEEMQGKVRVHMRIQPSEEAVNAVEVVDEFTITQTAAVAEEGEMGNEYAFDQAYGPADSNEKVFENVKHSVEHAIDGFNTCVVAWGLSGCGKTTTLFGSSGKDGLVQTSAHKLYQVVRKRAKKYKYSVKLSMMKVANEEIVDLLVPPNQGRRRLDVKKDWKGVTVVFGAQSLSVASEAELVQGMVSAMNNVPPGQDPSDSALVISWHIEGENIETQSVSKGRLTIYDLPGCDRDLPCINALHSVVEAVEKNKPVIPYTASPLTMLMSDCLGGNAKTLILMHVLPGTGAWPATEACLQLGLKMRNIKNGAHKNEVNRDILKLQKVLDSWKEQAGLPHHLFEAVDLLEITDSRETPE
ncbi:unnamed protein product [Ostreobium quekettii]|uniref:Kinesin motor domain-containing protein n=1 Tax=Ostreobium quekettii TaxID=121088 RepID=A0A8S1IXG3_9CHLO|nr:unnamed protein product [Ostreobium quekettii]|eukprot:evm.model.scf_2364.1 EVM.evm.TU.scf_2364.1   scf_2364:5929-20585(-)